MPDLQNRTSPAEWYIYLIRCSDNSLYTGITTDVERRLKEHQAGGKKAARYLRARGPLQLAFSCPVSDRTEALRLEYAIKQLSKANKEKLANGSTTIDQLRERLEPKQASD
ncbi:GIY-YIG nuclease family protein [Endozoicomonadaceae bacterium StTr2]